MPHASQREALSGALALASDFTQLALHALAHLAIDDPGRLDHPAYLAWSKRVLPVAAREPIERDARAMSALFAQDPRSSIVHALPELYRDVAQLRASAARDLRELGPSDIAAPWLLDGLREVEVLAELLRSAMALAAPGFLEAWRALVPRCEEGLSTLRPHLDEARALHPALRDARVELAWPLGARGRAFARRIVVGVPNDFAMTDPRTPAVLALHEAVVRAQPSDARDSRERYVRVEWGALVEVARAIAPASPSLRDAHAAWLASLHLRPLCEAARELGLVSAEEAAQIASSPDDRAPLLRAR